ncbi:MAG: stress response translation initiation inhibitor YciH [Pseudomonadales bacterium]
MASLKDQLSGLVYSTDKGATCPGCEEALDACRCHEVAEQARLASLDGTVTLSRQTKGRKGKGVTLVSGVALAEKELKALAKSLKQHCGTGGALKDGVIEIQGEQRQVLKPLLEKKGFKIKVSGG